ncbi:MAG: glycosyltransferase [Candidatus Scatovivens sp.]
MNVKIGVIVLNFNDYDNTNRYVNEISRYSCIDRIVVVDNSLEKKDFNFTNTEKIDIVISSKNEGYAKGNNLGINYLNENYKNIEYIVISNPDVIVPEESYNKCLQFLNKKGNSKYAIVSPRMYDANNNKHPLSGWKLRTLKGDTMDSSVILTNKFQKPHIEMYGEYLDSNDVVDVDCVAGSFFMIRNKIFKEIGYFDENTFLYFEEDIIGKKLSEAGYKVAVLNTCKFQHMEAVSVKRSMNYLKKYKLLQKSKRYYHKKYNKKPFYKLWVLDLATLLGSLEIYYNNSKYLKKIYRFIKKTLKNIVLKSKNIFSKSTIINIVKFLLYIYTIITWPVYMLMKLFRRKKHVLYFSVVTWKWIKQRPHFIPLEIGKYNKYKIDYRYQALRDKFVNESPENVVKNNVNKQKNFKIIPFKIFPAIEKYSLIDKIMNIIKTSLWNYDTIILTQPNQMHFFVMRLHKLRRTNIIYECMDNYEIWEPDVNGYRNREAGLIYFANHIIVSAIGLKNRIINLYNVQEKDTTVVRNAYDKDLFSKKIKKDIKLFHRNITYIGTIDDWFDFDSICKYAEKNTSDTIYLIGPVSYLLKEKKTEIERKYKNILFLGPIEHDLVPSYISESDVLIMPFILNDLIKCVDPVKVYEYLYLKKPVVSTYWNELEQFKNLMYFYDYNKNDFEYVIKLALENGFKESEDYNKIILNATWENRVKEYIKYL